MLEIFPHLHFSVSYTTRPKRPGDENGRDYYFISREDFQRMIDRGDFVEWAEIYGHRYGTAKNILEKIQHEGRDVILDIDGQGARQVRDQNLQGIFVFILPPSREELQRRLSRRRTEGKAALEERLRKAKAEMAEARWYDYIIVNDELEKAQDQLRAILLAEHCRRERMAWVIEDLLSE
jgi:guanylate kinase